MLRDYPASYINNFYQPIPSWGFENKDLVAGETTRYYYNNNLHVLSEVNGAGVTQRWFVYGNYIDGYDLIDDNGNDLVQVYKTGGSNNPSRRELIAEYTDYEGSPLLTDKDPYYDKDGSPKIQTGNA